MNLQQRVKKLIDEAEAILITAGAGIGVDMVFQTLGVKNGFGRHILLLQN